MVISVSVSQACVNRSSSRRAWKRRSMREDISGSGRPNCTQLPQHFIACKRGAKRRANESVAGTITVSRTVVCRELSCRPMCYHRPWCKATEE